MKKKLILCAFVAFFGMSDELKAQTTYFVPTTTAGSTGAYNTNVGEHAGSNSTNTNNNANTAVGYYAGSSASSAGDSNCFFGGYSGSSITTGRRNVFMGSYSGKANTTGNENTFIGVNAGVANTDGSFNVFLGRYSAPLNTTGSYNTFLGSGSGYINTTGGYNTIVGNSAGVNNVDGSFNTFFGTFSGGSVSSGSRNTFLGYGSGASLASGSNNTFLGSVSLPANTTLSNTIILADGQSNQRLYIDINGNAGIGLGNNPSAIGNRLEVKGAAGNSGLRLTNIVNTGTSITNTTNKILSVNATGDVILVDDKQGSGGAITNALNSSVNTMTSTVNGIASPAQIINTVVNTIASGQLTTTVNGVASTPVTLPATGGTDTSIYINDGTLAANRTVTMGSNSLIFNSTSNVGGKIYIGNATAFNSTNFPTNSGNYKLYVEGGVLTEKVKVALPGTGNWADYVFANDYKLMPLTEVESFVKANKHLPGVSSADNIVKEGLDLGAMQATQMQKIEELTLYAIEQNKTIEKQSKEIEELKILVNTLVNKNK